MPINVECVDINARTIKIQQGAGFFGACLNRGYCTTDGLRIPKVTRTLLSVFVVPSKNYYASLKKTKSLADSKDRALSSLHKDYSTC